MYLLKINLKNYRHFFIGQSYFNNDGAQLYLIPQLLNYTLKRLGDTQKVVSWKSKRLSVKKPIVPTTTDNSVLHQ